MSLRGAQRRGNLNPRRRPNPRLLHCVRSDTPHAVERSPLLSMSLRGAQRRGNLHPRRHPNPRLLHCLRNDTPHAVERSALTSMSLRGAQRRGNLHPRRHPNPRLLHCLRNDTPYAVERSPCSLCHCEERSDAAISTRGGAPTQDCFTAFAMTYPMPGEEPPALDVIARSAAMRQSQPAAAPQPKIASLRSQ
jgi:hypothetical protein